jgi:Icc-related predicted phosphoesterase
MHNLKFQAIIVSDLHLGTKDSKAEEFIEFIENHPTDLLILNGDVAIVLTSIVGGAAAALISIGHKQNGDSFGSSSITGDSFIL